MKTTIEYNFPGTVAKANTDEVNPDTAKMQKNFTSAYSMALAMGKATVAGLDLPDNPVPALETLATSTWGPYTQVPQKN
jgi:hypothetical protein